MAHAQARFRINSDFDFAKNIESRPFLFFFDDKPERKILVDGRPVNFRFWQEGGALVVETDSRVAALPEKLENWFGLGEDFSEFYGLCRKDSVLKNHLDGIKGLRLFSAPDDFEALVCIICSQMTGFPQYKTMTRKIYEAYGRFPMPKDVLARPSLLDGCGVGYRKKFILALAKSFPEWSMNSRGISTSRYNERIREEWREAPILKPGSAPGDSLGLGQYSKNIFTLFQRRDYSSFYEDSLIRKIASEHYGFEGKNIGDFASKKWGKWAGLAEVYLQKFLRDLQDGTA